MTPQRYCHCASMSVRTAMPAFRAAFASVDANRLLRSVLPARTSSIASTNACFTCSISEGVG